jgi:hypothetical protein
LGETSVNELRIVIHPIPSFLGHGALKVECFLQEETEIYQITPDWKKSIGFLNHLMGLRINNIEFCEYFRYDRTCLWQFLPSYIAPDIMYAIGMVEIFSKIRADMMPSRIHVILPDDRFRGLCIECIKMVFGDLQIKLSDPTGISSKQGTLKWLKKTRLADLYRKVRNQFVKTICGMLSFSVFHRASSHENVALIVSHGLCWTRDRNGRYFDRILYAFVPEIMKRGWNVQGIDCPYNSYGFMIRQFFRKRFLNTQDVHWESFLSYMTLFEERDCSRLGDLEKTIQGWQTSIAYEGFDFAPAIKFILQTVVKSTIPQVVNILDAAGTILDKINPGIILLTYETGPFARALIIKAHERKIPTVGFQHGMMHDNHSDYMHDSITNDPFTDGFVVPLKTFVWGNYWRDILCQTGSYPIDRVAVVGNWNIHTNVSPKGKDEAFSITFLLVGFTSRDLLLNVIDMVRSRFPGPISLRFHPSVSSSPYRDLGNRDVSILDSQIELPTVLEKSTLCVSELSTAALEAFAICQCPVLVMNLTQLKGYEFLKKFKEAYLQSFEDLNSVLEKLSHDSSYAEAFWKQNRETAQTFMGDAGSNPIQAGADIIADLSRSKELQ